MFLPRDKELDILKQAWAKAKTGCPQVVTLLAESGFGKTRIAQEFYNHLSTTEDKCGPDGYWPDQITTDGDNLRVNPRIEECGLNDGDPPFLWWGMRIIDTERRNGTVASTLSDGYEALKPHMITLDASMRGKDRKKARLKALVNMGGVFLSTPLGVAKTLVEEGANLIQSETKQRVETDELQPNDVSLLHQDQLEDTILDYLKTVCKTPPKGLEPRPIAILIDDAHWSGGNQSLVIFVKNLMQQAQFGQWPVLIIMTTWTQEWRLAQQLVTDPDLPRHLAALESMTIKPEWHNVDVPKLEGMAAMVNQAFGGLSGVQVGEFCDRTDGNPLFMTELIKEFQSNKKHFINKDQNQALTVEGMAYVKSCSSLTDLVDKRLKNSPENIQKILALASVQGVVFSHSIVNQLANSLGIENGQADLEAAHSPYAFITEPNNDQCEFKTREYQISAKKNLENLTGIENLDENLSAIILKLSNRDASKTDAELEAIIAYCFDKETELHVDAALNALQEAIDRTKQHYRIYDEELLLLKKITISERVFKNTHVYTLRGYNDYVCNLIVLGRYDEAERFCYDKIKLFKTELGEESIGAASFYGNLATILDRKGDFIAGEVWTRKALAVLKGTLGPTHESTLTIHNNLAVNLKNQRKLKEAKSIVIEVLSLVKLSTGPNSVDTADIYFNCASIIEAQGNLRRAEILCRSALINYENMLGPCHVKTATGYNNLASNFSQQGQHDAAEVLYRKAIFVWEQFFGPTHPETASGYHNLASNLVSQGCHMEAEPIFRLALKVLDVELIDHPITRACNENFSKCLTSLGKTKEATEILTKVRN